MQLLHQSSKLFSLYGLEVFSTNRVIIKSNKRNRPWSINCRYLQLHNRWYSAAGAILMRLSWRHGAGASNLYLNL